MAFHCEKCSYHAFWPFQFIHHVQRNHGNVYAPELFRAEIAPEPYSWICCDVKSQCKLARYEHCTKEHDTTAIQDEDDFKKEFERYSCGADCEYKGHSCLSLAKHHSSCQTKQVVESLVPKTQPSKQSITIEITVEKRAVRVKRPAPDATVWFFCNECTCQFPLESLLQTHMLVHTDSPELFRCKECSFRSRTYADLQSHLVIHKKITWYPCIKCSFRAEEKQILHAHMQTHTEKNVKKRYLHHRPFMCSKCPYKTASERNLTSHMLTHGSDDEEIVWFNCTECSYRTNFTDNLKSHLATHAAGAETWHSCTECSYRARSRQNLNAHRWIHTSKRDYNLFKCTRCSYRTVVKTRLGMHMLAHHRDEVDELGYYSCDKCSYKVKERRHLQSHFLVHSTMDDIKWHNTPLNNYLA